MTTFHPSYNISCQNITMVQTSDIKTNVQLQGAKPKKNTPITRILGTKTLVNTEHHMIIPHLQLSLNRTGTQILCPSSLWPEIASTDIRTASILNYRHNRPVLFMARLNAMRHHPCIISSGLKCPTRNPHRVVRCRIALLCCPM